METQRYPLLGVHGEVIGIIFLPVLVAQAAVDGVRFELGVSYDVIDKKPLSFSILAVGVERKVNG